MNKLIVIFALVLLLALAVPLCTARGPQGPRIDDIVDATYTTIPPNEMPTAALAEPTASECLGRYWTIPYPCCWEDT